MEVICLDSSDDEVRGGYSSPAASREACPRPVGDAAASSRGEKKDEDEDEDEDEDKAFEADDVPRSVSAEVDGDGESEGTGGGGSIPSAAARDASPGEGDDDLEILGGPLQSVDAGGARGKGDGDAVPRPSSILCTTRNEIHAKATEQTLAGEGQLPPEVPLPVGATWRVVLLMDHREFGCSTDFLQETRKKINRHFGGDCADVESLPSADYMFVARLISDSTDEILDERVLDTVIERKSVVDLSQCLIHKSKKYKPLSFFDAQMYKFQQNGISNKLFVMEGDEDRDRGLFAGAFSRMEKVIRLKRVKTTRLQLERGEWAGVDLICTRNKRDTIRFLIQKLEEFRRSFNPRRPPTKTMRELKLHIDTKMKMATFQEYLRLRMIGGIGVKKAMKAILDPTSDWDKSFVSPEGSSKPSKSTLEDRATFWPERAARVPETASSNMREIDKMAAAIAECQRAVSEFDKSEEGKERTKLDNKRKNSKVEMTQRESDDLDDLNRQRAALAQAKKAAKSDGDNEGLVAAAARALADFDASEDGGKKRGRLMAKRRHAQLVMSADDVARLRQLNEKRDALADAKRHSRPSVAECRRALREFDDSAEGRERRALDERGKRSKKKMTTEEASELEELNRRRGALSRRRKEAKRDGSEDFSSADRALRDFDESKRGRNRLNLMAKKRSGQVRTTDEEAARLTALNEKRRDLASKLHRASMSDAADAADAGESPTRAAASSTASKDTGKRKYRKRKEPPEQLVKSHKTDRQTSKGASVAAANDEGEASCGICFKVIDIWVDENIALCNRVAACGATFHQACLAARGYDISSRDGCIQCQPKSKFTANHKPGTGRIRSGNGRAADNGGKAAADVIVLNSDGEEKKDDNDDNDDVIVID